MKMVLEGLHCEVRKYRNCVMYTGRTVLWGLRCETVLGENCTVETALLEDYAVETML